MESEKRIVYCDTCGVLIFTTDIDRNIQSTANLHKSDNPTHRVILGVEVPHKEEVTLILHVNPIDKEEVISKMIELRDKYAY